MQFAEGLVKWKIHFYRFCRMKYSYKKFLYQVRNLTRNYILSVQGLIQSIEFNRELDPCYREAYSSCKKVIILYLILQIFFYRSNFRFIQLSCVFCHLGNYHTFMNLAWFHQQNQKHEISVPNINVQYCTVS